MGREPIRLLRLAVAGLLASFASAVDGSAGDRAYTIEDNSYTVEPGRFAIEITPVTYSHRSSHAEGELETDNWSLGYSIVRVGVARHTEAALAFESWQIAHARDPESVHADDPATDVSENYDGSGNIALRLKHNLVGNDGGRISVALMPYVRFPTGSHEVASQETEWGVIVPIDIVLTEKWTAALVAYGDWFNNSDNSGHHFESSVLLDFSRTIGSNWSVLFECYYQFVPESGAPPVGTVNVGVGRTWSGNFYAELGAMFGITEAADDVAAYLSFGRLF